MTGTLNPVSEFTQRMRHWVCEQSFVEDLPPSTDRGALDPGRRSIKGNQQQRFLLLHSRLQGNGGRGNVVSPPPPKGPLKVRTLRRSPGLLLWCFHNSFPQYLNNKFPFPQDKQKASTRANNEMDTLQRTVAQAFPQTSCMSRYFEDQGKFESSTSNRKTNQL